LHNKLPPLTKYISTRYRACYHVLPSELQTFTERLTARYRSITARYTFIDRITYR
jgi:hypothetical protein